MSLTLFCATCPRQQRLLAQYGALLDQGKSITCLFQSWGCLLSVESPVPSNLSAFSIYTEAGRPFTCFCFCIQPLPWSQQVFAQTLSPISGQASLNHLAQMVGPCSQPVNWLLLRNLSKLIHRTSPVWHPISSHL